MGRRDEHHLSSRNSDTHPDSVLENTMAGRTPRFHRNVQTATPELSSRDVREDYRVSGIFSDSIL